MDITDKSVIKWQRLQIKNLEDEILRLKTNLNGSQLVLQESIKEYMDEIVSKTDTINELKNTIERQEIKNDELLEKCKELDDDKTIALERIQDLEEQILKLRSCDNCKHVKRDYSEDYIKLVCKIGGCVEYKKWVWEFEEEQEE